jgi:hypothetical protein
VTSGDLFELTSVQRVRGALRVPLPKAGPQQLSSHFTQFECLREPLLGCHGTKNAEVQGMVGALFRVHFPILQQCYLGQSGHVND